MHSLLSVEEPMGRPLLCRTIPIEQIRVPPGHRDIRHLDSYMQSLREVGLSQPILVVPDGLAYRLIAGVHRLQAATTLGWDNIPAIILEVDGLHARLASIDENLIRQELTVLERAESLRERKEIYEHLHPETTQHAGPDRGHRDKRRNDFAAFTEAMAGPMGSTPRTVQQEVAIATRLTDAVKAMIRPLPIANRKVDLLRLAKQPPDMQQALAAELVAGRATTLAGAICLLGGERPVPASTPATLQAPATEIPSVTTGSPRLDPPDRPTLVQHAVGRLHAAAPIMAEGEITGRPAAEVLSQHLAALPWPLLVLVAGCVTGTPQEAAAAWLAAAQRDAEPPAEPREDETDPSPQGVDTGESETPHPMNVDSRRVSVMPAETVPRTADDALPQHHRHYGVAIPPTPVNRTSPDTERVRAAAIGMQEPAPAPGVSVGSEPPSPKGVSSGLWPHALAACRGEVPDAADGEPEGAGEDHDRSATCAPAIDSMPPLPACPQCHSSNVWRVFESRSGRLTCLACHHLFHPSDVGAMPSPPEPVLEIDTDPSPRVAHAPLHTDLIETLWWYYESQSST
jgi:ParB-like nuclease domain